MRYTVVVNRTRGKCFWWKKRDGDAIGSLLEKDARDSGDDVFEFNEREFREFRKTNAQRWELVG